MAAAPVATHNRKFVARVPRLTYGSGETWHGAGSFVDDNENDLNSATYD